MFGQKFIREGLIDRFRIIVQSLEVKAADWGPKPFRCVNAWFSHPSFKNFCTEKWNEYEVTGWRGFVIK